MIKLTPKQCVVRNTCRPRLADSDLDQRSVRLSQKTLRFTKGLKFKEVEARLLSKMVERESSSRRSRCKTMQVFQGNKRTCCQGRSHIHVFGSKIKARTNMKIRKCPDWKGL